MIFEFDQFSYIFGFPELPHTMFVCPVLHEATSHLFSFSSFCHRVDALLNVHVFFVFFMLYFPVYVQYQMLNLA